MCCCLVNSPLTFWIFFDMKYSLWLYPLIPALYYHFCWFKKHEVSAMPPALSLMPIHELPFPFICFVKQNMWSSFSIYSLFKVEYVIMIIVALFASFDYPLCLFLPSSFQSCFTPELWNENMVIQFIQSFEISPFICRGCCLFHLLPCMCHVGSNLTEQMLEC